MNNQCELRHYHETPRCELGYETVRLGIGSKWMGGLRLEVGICPIHTCIRRLGFLTVGFHAETKLSNSQHKIY